MIKALGAGSDNLEVSRVGSAYRAVEDHYAGKPGHGDSIDRGLMLIEELRTRGFSITAEAAVLAVVGEEAKYWQGAYGRRANSANDQVKRRDSYIDELEKRLDELVAENAALIKRREELLVLVANISQTTPLPSELEGWETQRAKLLAEVGTLRSVIQDLVRKRA